MELVESIRNISSIDLSSKTCCIVSNDTDMYHCKCCNFLPFQNNPAINDSP